MRKQGHKALRVVNKKIETFDPHPEAGDQRPTQSRAGGPLFVGVVDDELVIRIGVGTLAWAFESGEENQPFDEKANDFRRSWRVTDPHKFAKGVGNGLCDEEEDGSTPLTKILDEAFIKAVENDMGVDEDGRIVTNEMLTPDRLTSGLLNRESSFIE